MIANLLWEQRWHPFRGEWVVFASHRAHRPWSGGVVFPEPETIPDHDPTCALCPGNTRSKEVNPTYSGTFCFENDFPCFSTENAPATSGQHPYDARPVLGRTEVICYHPNHAWTIADLTIGEITSIVHLWRDRYLALSSLSHVEQVLIFESKGSLIGTSNGHPHGQIYAGNLVYEITKRELELSQKVYQQTGGFLGQIVAEKELAGPRIIGENDRFMACVPWFARYAYEVFIMPKRQLSSFADFDGEDCAALAGMISNVCIRYDNLWRMRMPYIMAVHQTPTALSNCRAFPFHLEFHPPLRGPNLLKYLAGPEIGGGNMINESNPDEKAAELKSLSGRLYRTERPRV